MYLEMFLKDNLYNGIQKYMLEEGVKKYSNMSYISVDYWNTKQIFLNHILAM